MKLTLRAFRTWLESLEYGAFVGYSQDCRNCPLARFIRDQGFFEVEVEPSGCSYSLTCEPQQRLQFRSRKLPLWASRFVQQVDRLGPEDEVTVTAFVALELLRSQRSSRDAAHA